MAWRVTSEVGRFDEALDHFASRITLIDAERKRVPAESRSRAFWIAGVAQLDVVARVREKVTKAIADGQSLEDFKKGVRADLKTTTDAHIETVFRNATQAAYNAGRWHQMTEPSVLRFRPYWLYDAVLDGRTTPICNGLNGTLLAASDPWWDSHTPPMHHRCRSSVRSLRKSEAEKRGLTQVLSDEPVPSGFGLSPRVAQEWRPESGSRPADLLAEITRKQATMAQRAPTPDLPKYFAPRVTTPEQPDPPLRPDIDFGGRTITLTTEQQKARQSSELMRSGHSKRVAATYETRRNWLLWDWQTGQARTVALVQQAAQREFSRGGYAAPGTFQPSDMTRTQRDLRRLHTETQAWFQARKIKTITVYRAVDGSATDADQAVESWTTDKAIAERRARAIPNGEVLQVTLPVGQVLARSGAAGWVDGPYGAEGELLAMW